MTSIQSKLGCAMRRLNWSVAVGMGLLIISCGWILSQQTRPTSDSALPGPANSVPSSAISKPKKESQPRPGKVDDADEFGSFMKQRGYSAIVLLRLRSGFLTVKATAA